jgi:arylsulfatase A-like enzyme
VISQIKKVDMRYFILLAVFFTACAGAQPARPNVVLLMTDDHGWGDVGFNGNKDIITPNLDRVCAQGARLPWFFAAAPVCSPTRGTVLTGRHCYRYGIWGANDGRLPKQEYAIATGLRDVGYRTGHFGKWHVGSPHPAYRGKGSNGNPDLLALPQWFGYDYHFLTHHAVATWDPYGPNGENAETTTNPYWENGKRVTDRLQGDDTKVIMDRVLPFVEQASKDDKPFLAVVWAHTPHSPLRAGPTYKKMYEGKGLSGKVVEYYAALTALDEQVGVLEKKLRELDEWENTMFWFCADNGPASHIRDAGHGSTDGMRGKKGRMFNGGTCVPAFVCWPAQIKAGSTISTPMSTMDYLPTVFAAAGAKVPDDRPLDGDNVLDLIRGKTDSRARPIPFRYHGSSGSSPALSLIDGDLRYYSNFDTDAVEGDMLYNYVEDRGEQKNIAEQYPEKMAAMRQQALTFLASCKRSYAGADYPDDSGYQALGKWKTMPNRVWTEPAPKSKKDKKAKKVKGKNKKKGLQ